MRIILIKNIEPNFQSAHQCQEDTEKTPKSHVACEQKYTAVISGSIRCMLCGAAGDKAGGSDGEEVRIEFLGVPHHIKTPNIGVHFEPKML